MIDRRGNHVGYAWTCDATFECHIAIISSFNQSATSPVTSINFHMEARPDIHSYGTGKDLRATTKRLKTIAVNIGGSLLRV